ncbi:glycerol-3-phosphate dehydrogenase [Desulfuromusa kysingii]|uniref:Glycerol-3-phosphate dehydrogenase n=1 Tax=Desulfuromusa kysingii TaxID=37625 RepID=A0A1H3X976_9BACT|nr:NAD(P)/FAD-dependent oxidoreductase [Desulfuromusa kysingii]SDZ95947.1 glycerol-3-phosphate dehydrogenase [Desulfuromusa kysingii]
MYDVIIIGGGVVGCALARELSRYNLHLALLEKEVEVGFGTSKTNSGIIHAGHHSSAGTLKGKFEWAGNQMWDDLAKDLKFGFRRIGELLIARQTEDLQYLQDLKKQGESRGVTGLELWDPKRLQKEEPNLSHTILQALHAPTAGVINPYEACFGLIECACQNGVELFCAHPVQSIKAVESGFLIHTQQQDFQSRIVLNVAGVYADRVAAMVGADNFKISPRKGEEYMLDRRLQGIVTHLIFPTPTATSKGVLIIPTVDGPIMVGPTAEDVDDREDFTTSFSGAAKVFASVQEYCPAISDRDTITEFAGLRAVADSNDFVIEGSSVRGFYNIAGIQSPGLTAAPAIATYVTEMLRADGIALTEKERWKADIDGPPRFSQMTPTERKAAILEDPAYGRIVCRCESVTEAEVLYAIQHGARTLDGVKFRVRAGMGRCQGGFCTTRIMDLLVQHLDVPLTTISKRGQGSEVCIPRRDQILAEDEV